MVFLDEALLLLLGAVELGFFSFFPPLLFFCRTIPGGFGAGIVVDAAVVVLVVPLFFFFVFFFSSGGGFT